MYVKTFHMWSIGFRDLKNIEIDTKIIVIGCVSADLLSKTCFGGGHLEFPILGGKRWKAVVFPVIFEIYILKTPLAQTFMLLSGSAHQIHISAPLF